jgi:hypothetical protein
MIVRYNAGLPAGVSEFDFEFTADAGNFCFVLRRLCFILQPSSFFVLLAFCFHDLVACAAGTFGCDDGCPGTYNMKLSVCELECDDSKHAGHAGASVVGGSAAFSSNLCIL